MSTDSKMKDLVGISVAMEQSSVRFYQGIAERTSDLRVKKLCLKRAEDEVQHVAKCQEMQMELAATYQPVTVTDAEFDTAMSQAELLIKMREDAGEQVADPRMSRLLVLAIEREKQAARFYQTLLCAFPKYADVINYLIREEIDHAQELEKLAEKMSVLI